MSYPVLIVAEGLETSDGRYYPLGITRWRDKIEFMFKDVTAPEHDGAVFVGNLENMRRVEVDGVMWIAGDLTYDTDEPAREAERLALEDKVRRVSADMMVTLEVVGINDDGSPEVEMVDAELIGATQAPMTAFGDARILVGEEAGLVVESPPLVAAANHKAARDWFTDPQLTGPTPLTVTDDGQVYGHLATWGTCHIGYDGVCVTPPASSKNYSYFCTGAVRVDGVDVPVGHITLGTGHASMSADAGATVAADIVAGEDDYGIWVAGAARPGVDLDALRAASLSGDWRSIEGNLELVAALAVNVPGFPVPRIAASIAQGEQTSLVASGIVQRKDDMSLVFDALTIMQKQLSELTVQMTDGTGAPVGDPVEQDAEVLDMTPAGRIARLLA